LSYDRVELCLLPPGSVFLRAYLGIK